MARKAIIVFAFVLVAALCLVASAQDPQANKQGGSGPSGYGHYPPWNGGYPGRPDRPWDHPDRPWDHRPHPGPGGHCRWGCCGHRNHWGECLRCC
uniref:Glycine-rich protein n=1 Tax=Oryza glaberrima TaxID=4538 RepID=I1P2H0_ORYGL